jgi:hypothetical protein
MHNLSCYANVFYFNVYIIKRRVVLFSSISFRKIRTSVISYIWIRELASRLNYFNATRLKGQFTKKCIFAKFCGSPLYDPRVYLTTHANL